MRRKVTGSSGFTFIEMLVVSTLVVVFTSILVVAYTTSSHANRDRRREADVKQMQVALEQYYEIYKSYPVANSVSSLLSNSSFTEFLQNSSIDDPLNTGVYKYTVSSNATTYQLGYTKESDQSQVFVNNIGK